jgi:hypothetical protein
MKQVMCKSKAKQRQEIKDDKANYFIMYKGKLHQRLANVMLKNLSIDREEVYIPFNIFQSVGI